MVTTTQKSDSFPSTIQSPQLASCEDASFVVGRIRLEWNGLAGFRELRLIRRVSDADESNDETRRVRCEEELIGEICEPFS